MSSLAWRPTGTVQFAFICLINSLTLQKTTLQTPYWEEPVATAHPGAMPTRVCRMARDKAVLGMAPTSSQDGWSCAPPWPHAWVLFNSLVWTQPRSMYQWWATTKWSIATWCASLEEPCGVATTAEKAWESTGALEKVHGEHAGQFGHQTRPRDRLPSLN